ncbi:MAG: MCE family protein [Armatimonadetes bacterium]|nr:MCE family protein [Armatimonadota bacterium]
MDVLLKNEAKVGLLVFGAVVALVAMYWFLRGINVGASTIHVYSIFRDARKLDKGADIRMAGVKVGAVSQISLTGNSFARVDMIIVNKTRIPTDSVARITTGGLIGDSYVDILPGTKRTCLKNSDKIESAEPMNYEKLISDIGGLVDELKSSVEGINAVVGDKKTIGNVKATMANMQEASESTIKLLESARLLIAQASPDIQRAISNMTVATENAVKMTDELQKVVTNDAAPATRQILAQAQEAMVKLNETMLEARGVITSIGGSVGKLDGSIDKVDQVLTSIDSAAQQSDEMLKHLTDVTMDMHKISSDEQVIKNIKDAIRSAAEATAQANELISSLNRRFGGSGRSTNAPKAEIPGRGFVSDALWNTDQGKYRFDANYTFNGENDNFYRLGAYNIGENTRVNLQAGQLLSSTTALRYGLYASRLGFGIDQQLGSRLLLSADGFRPNDPEYDLRAVLKLNRDWGLYGGYSNVFDRKGDVFLGLQYKN